MKLLPGQRYCECEHAAHFPEDVPETGVTHTPNGNPAHNYGAVFVESNVVGVRTPYGIFHVCRDCAADCYQNYHQVELRQPAVRK